MAARLIFERAARREIAGTAGGVFVALFAIMLVTQLIRLLGQAAGGRITSEAVLALLGFAALTYLPIILSLTLFVSVLLTLSRSYRDSEMIVWFSAGLSLTAWVRPVIRFAAPLLAAIAALSLFLSPWALSRSAEFRQKIESRDDVSKVSPGTFRESGDGTRVFFVEASGTEALRGRNIFVSSVQHGRLGVTVSGEGFEETLPNGDRFLVLLNGRRYEGTPGALDYRVMQFERYAVRIETRRAAAIESSPKSMSLIELVALWSPATQAEMLWRIGIPLAALNLVLVAIPLSFVNPRAGRTNNLILAILTYMVYNNLISICQAWVLQGKLRFEVGWWAVHVAMFALLLLLFWRRISIYSWFGARR